MEFVNIICTSCHKYSYCKECEQKNITNPSAIRRCQIAICELHYSKIHNKGILEVGCGSSKKGGLIKKIVEENNCRWSGVDIKKTDLTTHVCTPTHVPFEENSFDCVIGSQTLEHWKRPAKMLKEIRRVLRPEGTLFLSVPIHLHGGKIFVQGNFDSLEKLFLKSGYEIIKIETWRKDYCDLGPYLHPTARKHLRYMRALRKKGGKADDKEATIYLIHCILSKKKGNFEPWWKRKFFCTKKLSVRTAR